MVQLRLPEQLSTERLLLQRLRYEDAEEIFYTYASKPEVTRFVAWPTHQTVDDTRGFLRYAVHAWNQGTDCSYTIRVKENNRLAGSFGVMNDNGVLQFGYFFSPTHWGKGYATEVCRMMMPLLKKQDGIRRIHTFVDVDNVASAKVLRKSGLVEEEIKKDWFRFINQGKVKDCHLFYFPL